jgi:hypothetical protein
MRIHRAFLVVATLFVASALPNLLAQMLANIEASHSAATISLTGSFIPSAFSANGMIAAGRAGGIAAVYNKTDGVTLLGTFPEADSQASDVAGISADGTIVTGYSRSFVDNEAFRWTLSTGLQKLKDITGHGPYGPGLYTGNPNTRTFFTNPGGISRNGQFIVGAGGTANGQEAFIWSISSGFTALGDVAGGNVTSTARDVTDSGSTILGNGYSSVNTLEMLKWNEDRQLSVINTGISQTFRPTTIGEGDTKAVLASSEYIVELDLASGATDIVLDSSRFSDINISETFADGSLNTFVVAQRYFYFRDSDAVFTVSDFLASNSIELDSSWTNIRVTGISDDGKVFGGRLIVNGTTTGFIATVPEPSTYALLAMSAASALWWARRRR